METKLRRKKEPNMRKDRQGSGKTDSHCSHPWLITSGQPNGTKKVQLSICPKVTPIGEMLQLQFNWPLGPRLPERSPWAMPRLQTNKSLEERLHSFLKGSRAPTPEMAMLDV